MWEAQRYIYIYVTKLIHVQNLICYIKSECRENEVEAVPFGGATQGNPHHSVRLGPVALATSKEP